MQRTFGRVLVGTLELSWQRCDVCKGDLSFAPLSSCAWSTTQPAVKPPASFHAVAPSSFFPNTLSEFGKRRAQHTGSSALRAAVVRPCVVGGEWPQAQHTACFQLPLLPLCLGTFHVVGGKYPQARLAMAGLADSPQGNMIHKQWENKLFQP